MRNSKQIRAEIEELIFESFHNDISPADNEELQSKLEELKLSKTKLEDLVSQHYYLAPRNLRRAQLMFAALSITVALALAAVRISNDIKLMAAVTGLGVLIALPYIGFHRFYGTLQELQKVDFVSKVSFAYTVAVAIFFTSVCIFLNLIGVILIPLLMSGFFFIELKKLQRLLAVLGIKT